MTKTRYAVLRRLDPAGLPGSPLGPGIKARGTGSNDGPPSTWTLEFNDCDENDQPGVHAAAAPAHVPVRLIKPITCGDPLSIAGMPPEGVGTSWGIAAVGAESADERGGRGITVAVLDTGIDKSHPAFTAPDLSIETKNFCGGRDEDEEGHGTHCAGTIFGRDVNKTRIGIARGVGRALIGKVLSPTGGTLESILDGIDWAIKEEADIISMSLGIDFPGYQRDLQKSGMPAVVATSKALVDYVATVKLFESLEAYVAARAGLQGRSVLLVAAAGNESLHHMNPPWAVAASPPACADGFIAVAALSQAGRKFEVAPFSNTNATISAPGCNILSAWPNERLMTLSGTSMAAPHVAGVAALWGQKLWALYNGFNAKQVAAQMFSRCRQLPLSTRLVGVGMVQAPQ